MPNGSQQLKTAVGTGDLPGLQDILTGDNDLAFDINHFYEVPEYTINGLGFNEKSLIHFAIDNPHFDIFKTIFFAEGYVAGLSLADLQKEEYVYKYHLLRSALYYLLTNIMINRTVTPLQETFYLFLLKKSDLRFTKIAKNEAYSIDTFLIPDRNVVQSPDFERLVKYFICEGILRGKDMSEITKQLTSITSNDFEEYLQKSKDVFGEIYEITDMKPIEELLDKNPMLLQAVKIKRIREILADPELVTTPKLEEPKVEEKPEEMHSSLDELTARLQFHIGVLPDGPVTNESALHYASLRKQRGEREADYQVRLHKRRELYDPKMLFAYLNKDVDKIVDDLCDMYDGAALIAVIEELVVHPVLLTKEYVTQHKKCIEALAIFDRRSLDQKLTRNGLDRLREDVGVMISDAAEGVSAKMEQQGNEIKQLQSQMAESQTETNKEESDVTEKSANDSRSIFSSAHSPRSNRI